MFVRFKYTTTLKEKAHYLWPDSRGRTLDNVSCRQHQSRSFLAYGIAVKAERRMIAKVGRVVCSEEPRLGVADGSSVEAQALFTKRLCRFMASC
jgi:hypothetical protein